MGLKEKLGNALGMGGFIHVGTRLDIRHFALDESGSLVRMCQDGTKRRFREVLSDRRTVINKKVTTAYVNFLVDQHQTESSLIGDFKYHEMGLGSTAENASDTALETTTGIARVTGTQTEGSSANIYKSVGTVTADTTETIREHGLFNASSGATLMDRTVFGAISVVSGNQIEFSFEITYSSGG